MTVADVAWLELDRSLRRRIARSVRTGAAVSQPREAAVAVGYCTATLEWLYQRDRLRPFHLVVAMILLADLLITWTWPVIPLLGAALGFGLVRLRTPKLRRRLTAALQANLSFATDSRVTTVRVRLPGQSWLHSGVRRRRLVFVLEAALAFLAFAAIATAFVPADGRWAAKANRICTQEEARLTQLRARRLDPSQTLERRIVIERGALVALDAIGERTPLASRLLSWRRYEVELDAWLAAAAGDPRVLAQQAHRAKARRQARALATRLGAETCARL